MRTFLWFWFSFIGFSWLLIFINNFNKGGTINDTILIDEYYKSGKVYTVLDFLRDSKLHFLIWNNKTFSFLFFFISMFTLWGQFFITILSFIISPFFLIQTFLIRYFFPFKEVRMYRINYFINSYPNFFSVVKYFLIQTPLWISFVVNYLFLKMCCLRQLPPRTGFWKLFHNFAFKLCFGVSSWNILFSLTLSMKIIDKLADLPLKYWWLEIKIILINHSIPNQKTFKIISEELRIFVENGYLNFNPTNKNIVEGLSRYTNDYILVRISSKSKSGKLVDHVGHVHKSATTVNMKNWITNKKGILLPVGERTHRLVDGQKGVVLYWDGSRESWCSTNTIFHSQNMCFDPEWKIVQAIRSDLRQSQFGTEFFANKFFEIAPFLSEDAVVIEDELKNKLTLQDYNINSYILKNPFGDIDEMIQKYFTEKNNIIEKLQIDNKHVLMDFVKNPKIIFDKNSLTQQLLKYDMEYEEYKDILEEILKKF